MGQKANELRARALRLEERAGRIADETIRSDLMSVAQRGRELAEKVEQYEMEPIAPRSPAQRQHRKVVIAGIDRAIRAYWEYAKALPVPGRLANVATSPEASEEAKTS